MTEKSLNSIEFLLDEDENIFWMGRPIKNTLRVNWLILRAILIPFYLFFSIGFLIYIISDMSRLFLINLILIISYIILIHFVFIWLIIKEFKKRKFFDLSYFLTSKKIYLKSPLIKEISGEFFTSPNDYRKKLHVSAFKINGNVISIKVNQIKMVEIISNKKFKWIFGWKGYDVNFGYELQALSQINKKPKYFFFKFSQIDKQDISKLRNLLLNEFLFQKNLQFEKKEIYKDIK